MEELKYLTEQIENGFYGVNIVSVKLCYKDNKPTFNIECSNIKLCENLDKINDDLKKKFETNQDYNIKLVYVGQKKFSKREVLLYLDKQILSGAYHPNIISCSFYVQNEKEIYGLEYKDDMPELDFDKINNDLKSLFNTDDDFNFKFVELEDVIIETDGIDNYKTLELHHISICHKFFMCLKYLFCHKYYF